jgi:hypothetical protein
VSFVPGHETAPGVIFITSPIDDTHHNFIYGVYSPYFDLELNEEGWPVVLTDVTGNLPYQQFNYGRFTGDRDNNYGQNRDAMRQGHFSGFDGNLLQEDMVTQASMGPIVDRTLDHLSSSDVAIMQALLMLLQALKDHAAGKTPTGAEPGADWREVHPENYIILRGRKREEEGGTVDLVLREAS